MNTDFTVELRENLTWTYNALLFTSQWTNLRKVAPSKSFPKQSGRHVIHEKGAILELQTIAITGRWSGEAVRKQATLPTSNYALLT
jgi:hypothetical protein